MRSLFFYEQVFRLLRTWCQDVYKRQALFNVNVLLQTDAARIHIACRRQRTGHRCTLATAHGKPTTHGQAFVDRRVSSDVYRACIDRDS